MNTQEIRSRLARWRWQLLTLMLVSVAAIYWLLPVVLGPLVPAFAVARSELIQTVVASGRVENPARIDIGSQSTGEVVEVPVTEGQTVQARQLLIRLENSDEVAALDQAKAAVNQAGARLRQLQDLIMPLAEQALVQARANLANARKQHERALNLAANNFIGKSQLDDAARNLEIAQSQMETAQLQVATSRANGADYAIAQASLQQARAAQAAAAARLEHMLIQAPVAGTLISRNVERGDVVQPGKTLMVLSPTGPTQLVVQIDEKNLRYLSLGQRAIGSADGYPGNRFPVELAYINPAVDPTRGSVAVKLNVPSPPDYLRQDMTVSVDIEVARLPDALSLPPEAIRDAAGASPWVMLAVNGRAVKRAVKLGIRGDKRIQILDGVTDGDLVLQASGDAVTEDDPVRPVATATRQIRGK